MILKQNSGIGDTAVSEKMKQGIELWSDMFCNKSPWICENTQSLNLASSITNELARLVVVEFESEVSGSIRAESINDIYKQVLIQIKNRIEYALALGGIVFKPFYKNNKIYIDYVEADRFVPLSFDSNGNITSAVFVSSTIKGNSYYTKLETHQLTNSGYIITNKAYHSLNVSDIGVSISLKQIEEWSDLSDKIILKYADGSLIDKPLFSYFKTPLANQVDRRSFLGVSVYSRAVDLIKEADKQYSRILWEFEGSELAIDASVGALEFGKMPTRRKRLFSEVDIGADNNLYQVFSPTIRDSSLFNGLNQILKRIEFACCLSYGTLSDPQSVEKTAEEIKMSKQRSYSAVCDIQKALQDSLDNLIWIIDFYTTLYNIAPKGDYEISFKWGDGVLTDMTSEFNQKKALVDSGYLKPEILLSWYFGITEEEAKNYLPESNSISFGSDE